MYETNLKFCEYPLSHISPETISCETLAYSFESSLNPETSRDYDMRSLDSGGGLTATGTSGDTSSGGGGGEKFAPPVRLCRFSHDGRQLAVVYDTGNGGSPTAAEVRTRTREEVVTRVLGQWAGLPA